MNNENVESNLCWGELQRLGFSCNCSPLRAREACLGLCGSVSRDLVHKDVQWEVRSIFVVVKHYCWHALIVFAVKLKAITRVGNQLNDHKELVK